jgi:hypothetical protein
MAQFESIKFQPQRPLLRELSADRLNTILQEIRRNKPKGERGITVRHSGDGTYIGLAANTASGSFRSKAHPFKVVTRVINETLHWGVTPESIVYTSLSPDGGIVPEGALTTLENDDPGWLPVDTQNEDYIYIVYDQENLTIAIESLGSGGSLDVNAPINGQGAWLQVDTSVIPPQFLFARKIIASAQPQQNQNPSIAQGILSHQLLQDICIDGMAARWLFDYSAGASI